MIITIFSNCKIYNSPSMELFWIDNLTVKAEFHFDFATKISHYQLHKRTEH